MSTADDRPAAEPEGAEMPTLYAVFDGSGRWHNDACWPWTTAYEHRHMAEHEIHRDGRVVELVPAPRLAAAVSARAAAVERAEKAEREVDRIKSMLLRAAEHFEECRDHARKRRDRPRYNEPAARLSDDQKVACYGDAARSIRAALNLPSPPSAAAPAPETQETE